MTLIDALEAIEAASQGNARLETIKKHDSEALCWYFIQALSPDVTFGIKKLPKRKPLALFRGDFEWEAALRKLQSSLETRLLSGNAAQVAVAEHLSDCNELQQKWSERALRQDLRINIGAKDVNNALGEIIYLFAVPLATDFRKVKPKDLEGTWAIQPKLDGGRCVAVMTAKGGPVKLLSRTGKEWGNFESIRKELQEYNKNWPNPETYYLDGEVVSYQGGHIDFQSIQKTMMRKDGVEVGNLKYVVFDSAPEDEWKNPVASYARRYVVARSTVYLAHLHGVSKDKVDIIESEETTNLTVNKLEELCALYTEAGWEGAMARRWDVPVEPKRGKKLLKVKTFLDDEAEVLSAVEGTGKYEGMLGALVCKAKNGKIFEIGSGFDDEQRKEIWQLFKYGSSMIRPRWVSYKYQNTTDAGVPRFPIFRCFRHEDDV